jgi:hypothetical protein
MKQIIFLLLYQTQADWKQNNGTGASEASKFFNCINFRNDFINASYATSDIKHLEITVPAPSTPSDNSIFFSSNF